MRRGYNHGVIIKIWRQHHSIVYTGNRETLSSWLSGSFCSSYSFLPFILNNCRFKVIAVNKLRYSKQKFNCFKGVDGSLLLTLAFSFYTNWRASFIPWIHSQFLELNIE